MSAVLLDPRVRADRGAANSLAYSRTWTYLVNDVILSNRNDPSLNRRIRPTDSNRKEPFVQFQEFKLDTRILAGVRTLGWEQPTPIQEQAIPRALEGRDVMGLARTGTGKTAAFLLPILQRLATGHRGHVRALIVAPTRELAEQIHQQAVTLCRPLNLRSLSIYGGVNINPQMRALRAGVDIVVACPGRLLDHLGQKTVSLAHVEVGTRFISCMPTSSSGEYPSNRSHDGLI